MEAATLVIGIFIGILISFQYTKGERRLRRTQEQINKDLKKDLKFYKELSENHEKISINPIN